MIVSLLIAFRFPELPFRSMELQVAAAAEQPVQRTEHLSVFRKIVDVCKHAIEEFFSVGKYLVVGAFVAACMQTFIPTSSLIQLGSNPVTSSLVMIGLAFVMSLCSEADAFIASSFRSTFSIGSLSAFLVFGPMIDMKNTLMLLGTFRGKFVVLLIVLVTLFTLLGSLLVGRIFG